MQRQTETLAAYNVRTKLKTNTRMEGYGPTNTTLFHLYQNGDLPSRRIAVSGDCRSPEHLLLAVAALQNAYYQRQRDSALLGRQYRKSLFPAVFIVLLDEFLEAFFRDPLYVAVQEQHVSSAGMVALFFINHDQPGNV